MEFVTKKISEIQFGLLDPEKIRKFAVVKIITPELYDKDGFPVEGGLMDTRMGVIDPGLRCRTCGKKYGECPGHFGYIELARPVIHVQFVDEIYDILRAVCHKCGKLKIEKEKKKVLLKKIEKIKEIYGYWQLKKYIKKKVFDVARKNKKCPYCGYENPEIKLVKPYRFYIKVGNEEKWFTPIEIRSILEKIPEEDYPLIGFDPKNARPEWMILTVLPVPPVTVRPSIILESGERAEDDLTHKLADIVRTNIKLQEAITTGSPELIVEELWNLLQYHVATYINNTLSNIPVARHRSGKKLKSLVERIAGKEGRLRYNLLGKRVNYSARAVIVPDPYIGINEVGVPLEVAKILTVPERVTEWNIEWMKKLVLNGPNKYPGANYIIKPDGKRFRITDNNKEELANDLQPGWIVERHLMDGDIVLFNRYPSIHRMSVMAHYVRVFPDKVFKIHPSACPPYNADFDGDEMNIHVPQTEEARAEARLLLDVKYHFVVPKTGDILVGGTQDIIAGAYLLTRDETKIKFDEAMNLVYYARGDLEKLKKYIERAKKEGRDYLTGKEVFSAFLPDDLNFESEKIKIKNGELIEGVIDKSAIGSEKGKLLRYIYDKYGPEFTLKWLEKVDILCIHYLSMHGLTVSLSDWDLPKEAIKEIDKIKEDTHKKVIEIQRKYLKGELVALPGKTLKETMEIYMQKVLNEARDKISEIVEKNIKEESGTMILIKSKARGNILNIAQIVGVLGQQSLRGRIIEFGYKDRNLPIFEKGSLDPKVKGWVDVGYKEGLRPWEMFFHAMPGRDSLMDTAIRTAHSGYLYRRMVYALHDLYVEYDGTVRDSFGRIIQFLFGEDGLEVRKTDSGKFEFKAIIKEVLENATKKD